MALRKSDDFVVPMKSAKADGGKGVARRKSCKNRTKDHTQGWEARDNTERPVGFT